MTPAPVTLPIDWQTRLITMGAEAVETGDLAAEQFVRMLTVEVGHTDSEVVYAENALELHRYEPDDLRHETPILIVYALVNRPYILDLQPDRSVIRRLLEAGFRVYLIDWGEPSRLDTHLGMADYVCRYLDNCVDAARDDADVDDLHVLGYCMGGTMALMYASRNEAPIRTLTCMATPVAFDGDGGILEQWADHFDPGTAVDAMGNVPGDVLAVEFSMMDPIENYLTKYVRLYENMEDDDFVENFARMERWIWDGVDVAGRAFREFVDDVYRHNRLADGTLELAGERVDLSAIEVPVCGIVGQYDHVVPADSTRPLFDLVASDDADLLEFSAGHIGISVSSRAHEDLWPDVTDWLAERSRPADDPGGDESRPAEPPSDPIAGDEMDAATTASRDDRERARQTVETVARRAEGRLAAASDGRVDSLDDRERAQRTVEAVAQRAAGRVTADRHLEATPSGEADAPSAGEGDGSTPVEAVDGIGPTYAERLAEAEIRTVGDLREYDVPVLAAITDAPPGQVARWLDRAPSP